MSLLLSIKQGRKFIPVGLIKSFGKAAPIRAYNGLDDGHVLVKFKTLPDAHVPAFPNKKMLFKVSWSDYGYMEFDAAIFAQKKDALRFLIVSAIKYTERNQ